MHRTPRGRSKPLSCKSLFTHSIGKKLVRHYLWSLFKLFKGDSGGPVMFHTTSGQWITVGVASMGNITWIIYWMPAVYQQFQLITKKLHFFVCIPVNEVKLSFRNGMCQTRTSDGIYSSYGLFRLDQFQTLIIDKKIITNILYYITNLSQHGRLWQQMRRCKLPDVNGHKENLNSTYIKQYYVTQNYIA